VLSVLHLRGIDQQLHTLRLFGGLVDGADEVEGFFRHCIMAAVEQRLTALNGVPYLNILTRDTRPGFCAREGLRQEAM
jgi:hypothetical protein